MLMTDCTGKKRISNIGKSSNRLIVIPCCQCFLSFGLRLYYRINASKFLALALNLKILKEVNIACGKSYLPYFISHSASCER